MREIKFRAWDKRTRKMVYTGFHLLGEVSAFDLLYQYGMEHGKRKDEPGLLRLNSFVIMEYTGLKDKNGKEIFEDDLIINQSRNNKKPIKVIFKEGAFKMKYQGIIPYLTEYECLESEVIGNIYENPELMEEL